MSDRILSVEGVTVSFDGFKVLDSLDFAMDYGELRFLIGPNGAGKTTLLDLITGKTRHEREKTGQLLHTLEDSHSILVVEHDMAFVREFSRTVTVLHLGQLLSEGPMEKVQADPRVVEVYLGRGKARAA